MPQSTFSTMLELCSLIVNDCGLIKISNNWYFNKNHALWDIYKKTQIFEKVEIRDTTLYVLSNDATKTIKIVSLALVYIFSI